MGASCSSVKSGGGDTGYSGGVRPEDEPNDPDDTVVFPPSEPDPNEEEATFKVTGLDCRVEDNANNHHTDEYEITTAESPRLVVRRGHPFVIQIDLSRPYEKDIDELRLGFQTGKDPKRRKGTLVEFVPTEKDRQGTWGARITQSMGSSLVLNVFTPPECFVGRWYLTVDVRSKGSGRRRWKHKDPIYVLFNPWCQEDMVFMKEGKPRGEYVLNDQGRLYVGSMYNISSRPWSFGQFTKDVLDCTIDLLDDDRSFQRLDLSDRGNPILVARRLTALINAPGDNGVLVGNWSGVYSGGKSPLSWTGSAPILDEYRKSGRPVKYGQCWVFSGVLTTVCRALGMPARSVTNFSSAHDTDASITIDVVMDSDGKKLKEYSDSIWNFHVWNEVWMTRPELPDGYGGWQVCDATPQEKSEGVFCCGPCPVRAIKEGEVHLPYDGRFIFAEVNADRVHWMKHADGSFEKRKVDKRMVGKSISTKSLGNNRRQDLTLEYKHYEGSAAERVSVRRAQQLSSSFVLGYADEDLGPCDMEFTLLFDAEHMFVGNDFILKLDCVNKSDETRSVSGTIDVMSMFYTGIEADDIVNHRFRKVEIQARQRKAVELELTESKYLDKLKDMCMLSFTVLAKVEETNQIFTKTDHTRLRKPHLRIEGPSEVQRGKEFVVNVSFTNPLCYELTNCELGVEAAGIVKATKYQQGNVEPKGQFECSLTLKARKTGSRELIFVFSSKQLEDINSTHDIHVIDP